MKARPLASECRRRSQCRRGRQPPSVEGGVNEDEPASSLASSVGGGANEYKAARPRVLEAEPIKGEANSLRVSEAEPIKTRPPAPECRRRSR